MKISIKTKYGAFLALLLLSTLSILSILVLQGIKNNQKKQYEDYLTQQGEIVSNYVKQTNLMEPIKDSEQFTKEQTQGIVRQFEMMSGMHVVLYNMAGNELANSRPLVAKTDVSGLLKYVTKDKSTYFEEGNNITFLYPVNNSNKQIGVIEFSYSIEKNKTFYTNIKHLFLYVGAFVFVICFILGYLYINQLTEGILKLKNVARNIEEGNYTSIVQLKRNDELGELSRGIYFMGFKIKKNIDEMKEEKQKLELAVNKLEISRKQQKQFIGNVTHEFKTPLTVIKAYADLMEMYPSDGELMKEGNENINKEIRRLSDMVEKVLTLSSLEKYDFLFKREPVDISDILMEVCLGMKGKVQKYGLRLHTDLEHHIIFADKESLTQVFINLIDNAIKYNHEGGEIWVECSVKENGVRILVKDTGIGIPLDSREKIFEPFYTVNKDRSTKSGGTGLGLSLVKELVERQGGTIVLLDTEKEETVFEIKFENK